MKHTLPLIAMFASSAIMAQPVLTSADVTPALGATDISHSTQYVAAGPATANFTFNVGSLTLGAAGSGTVVAASSTPYAITFPNATLALTPGFGFYTYTSVDATAANYWGFAFDSDDLYPNSDPEITVQLPCSMGTNWTDAFSGTGLSSGESFNRTGSVTGHYNGYGTLILPFGTFNNVARIELDEDYTDDYSGLTNHYTTTVVSYVIPGHTLFRSTTITTTVSGGSPQTTSTSAVIDASAVGIDELSSAANGLHMFPNPAQDEFSISSDGKTSAGTTVDLFDALGREVMALSPVNGMANGTVLTFNVSSVPRGMYIVRVMDAQGRSSNMPLVLR